MMKRTPLFEIHRSFKAKLINFSGFEMPVQYRGIKEEHLAVRKQAGLFDVSHMGEISIKGDQAVDVVEELSVNNASRLKPGKAQYTVMCREHGGIVDDLLIYCLSDLEYMLVVNASNIEKDLEWVRHVNNGRAEISNLSDEIALIAIQGPKAHQILNKLTDEPLQAISPFEFRTMKVSDYENILVSATGYTGEPGYELYCNIRFVNTIDLWENIMLAGDEFGLNPCGLGSRDTLRLEAGLLLYGNDITEETTPLEAGLEWLINWDKKHFIGKKALLEQKKKGISRKLRGMIMLDSNRIPRNGYSIVDSDGQKLGEVTSGGLSVLKERGIALGYLPAPGPGDGDTVFLEIRNKQYPMELVRPPFHKIKK